MTMINHTLLFFVRLLFNLYIYVILIRIILEWIQADYYHPVVQFVVRLTKAPVNVLHKIIPSIARINFSSIIFLLIIELCKLIVLCLFAATWPNIGGLIFWLLIDLVSELINLYAYLIMLQALSSWLNSGTANATTYLLYALTNPLLRPIRRIIRPIKNIDLSPIIAFLILQLINTFLIYPLLRIATGMTLG